MFRDIRGMVLPLALAVLLTATAGRCTAQGVYVPPPHVSEAPASPVYYPPATSYYYAPPAVSYYAPPPSVSYYTPPAISYYGAPATSYYEAPPAVSYYQAPAVSYYARPATYPVQTVTTRYGLFGRPRVSVSQYYAP